MLRQLKVYKDGIHYIGIPHKESKARGRRPRREDLVEVLEEEKEEEKAGGKDPSAFSGVAPMPAACEHQKSICRSRSPPGLSLTLGSSE